MPKHHLVSHHLCPYVQRAVIVLTEKGIPHKRTYIDLSNKPDWFLALSPLGRVPVLQVGDSVVFESQVIAEYLDEVTPGSLHPASSLEKARHRSWIEYGSETLQAITRFYNAQSSAAFDEERATLRQKFERIQREVEGPFFAGETFHMIDGVWGTIFGYFDVFDTIADFGILASLDGIADWRRSVMERASVAGAPPAGYTDRLRHFLANRNSHLATLLKDAA